MARVRRIWGDDRGQASVELVAVLPAVLLVTAVVWQCALTGYTAWMAAHAARAGARADVVGRDAGTAARAALPSALERGLSVDRGRSRAVRVRLRVPLLWPGWKLPVSVGAVSSLGAAE